MSGFDVTMRSQQQVAQGQQFYDSQRYQMMAQTGQSIAQAPAMVQEMGLRRENMNLQQRSMGLQEQQAQAAMQELQMRKQDADMRLALQQQEFQSNAMKLQAMTAIDQADLMAEQVRGAKLQNDAIEFDMKNRQQQYDLNKENTVQNRIQNLLRAGGGVESYMDAGIEFDPNDSSKPFKPMDPDRLKEWRASRVKVQQSQQFSELKRYHDSLASQLSAAEEHSPEDVPGILEQMRLNSEEMKKYMGHGGGGTTTTKKDPKPMTPAQQQEQTKLDAYVAETVDMGRILWGPSQTMSSSNPNGIPPQPKISKERYTEVASWLFAQRDRLHKQATAAEKAGRKNMIVGSSPEETARLLMAYLQSPGEEETRAFLGALIGEGVLTQEEGERLFQR